MNLFARVLFVQGASSMFTQPVRPFCIWEFLPLGLGKAAETTQPWFCSVRFCSGGEEAPALSNSVFCVCTCSAASRKPARSFASLRDVHAIFPLPHIQDFSPKPYSRTFVNNAVHSSQGKEHRESFFFFRAVSSWIPWLKRYSSLSASLIRIGKTPRYKMCKFKLSWNDKEGEYLFSLLSQRLKNPGQEDYPLLWKEWGNVGNSPWQTKPSWSELRAEAPGGGMSPLLKDKESLDLISTGRVLWAVNRSKALTDNSRNLSFCTSGDIV